MMTRLKYLLLFLVCATYACITGKKVAHTKDRPGMDAGVVTYTLPGSTLLTIAKKILYKKTPQEDMYLYVLYPREETTKPLPAIVYFTGGGWLNGNVADEIPSAAWFRDHGMIAITADYRVKNRHSTTPLEAIKDARSAMRYLRGNAKQLGIDPNKIIAAGGSAGGHLAICTLVDSGDEETDDLSISAKPNGLVLHNPVLGEGFGLDFLQEYPQFTPLNIVKAGWPPTVISCGTKDGTTPYSGAVKFTKLMKDAGNICELITVNDADHSCDWPVSNPNFLPTFTRMTTFLQEQGLLAARQSVVQASEAQEKSKIKNWQQYISLEKYLLPFWKADTIYDENVQIIKSNGHADAALLFKAAKILSVRSADLKVEYPAGKDWNYADGKIVLSPNSAIPFIAWEDLVFTTEKPGLSMMGKKPGTFVLFSESDYLTSKQLAVTYIPQDGRKWAGPLSVFAGKSLPVTISKLLNGQDIKIVFFGNSIETGCNSSGFMNKSPYMPSWPELIVYGLKQHYKGKIEYNNQSVGGKIAQWGREVAASTVVPQNPDLVIIGFGMNDGTIGIPPSEYTSNVQAIMNTVLTHNSKAEFILIAPMLANPDAVQDNMQASYKVALDKLTKKGVVVADVTGVHTILLKSKSYQDMTGNNVNHPNDYLSRWYAQFIAGLIVN